VNQQRFRSAKT